MPKPNDHIQKLIEKADAQAAAAAVAPAAEAFTVLGYPQPEDVSPGMVRVHLVSEKHNDGIARKTWLKDSVFEIDQYTAQWMIDVAKCAFPTSEPINEILVPYEGK